MLVVPIRGDPLRLPVFVHLRGLKPGGVALRVVVFAPDADLPEIAGARLERDRGAIGQTVDAGAFDPAAVEKDLLEVAVTTDHDLRGGLYRILGFTDDPGKSRLV
ncbi:MAG: hypothetical protein IPK52_20475 [Chloroflexi bacterium]|nr:hypothetical protein [Chloroflexota bacterium]